MQFDTEHMMMSIIFFLIYLSAPSNHNGVNDDDVHQWWCPNSFDPRILCKFIQQLRSFEVFCKDFVDISNENASFYTIEDSMWLQLIYFFNWNWVLVYEIYFSYRRGQSKLTTSECITQINHYGKVTPLHKLISTALQFIN